MFIPSLALASHRSGATPPRPTGASTIEEPLKVHAESPCCSLRIPLLSLAGAGGAMAAERLGKVQVAAGGDLAGTVLVGTSGAATARTDRHARRSRMLAASPSGAITDEWQGTRTETFTGCESSCTNCSTTRLKESAISTGTVALAASHAIASGHLARLRLGPPAFLCNRAPPQAHIYAGVSHFSAPVRGQKPCSQRFCSAGQLGPAPLDLPRRVGLGRPSTGRAAKLALSPV